MTNIETAEAADLSAPTLHHARPYGVEDRVHRNLDILGEKLRVACCQLGDQVGLGHSGNWMREVQAGPLLFKTALLYRISFDAPYFVPRFLPAFLCAALEKNSK